MGRNQRKWRNILLDRNFQLSFTMLLVGLAALLMALLGLWVKDVARESTLVGQNQVEPICADLEDAVSNPARPIPAGVRGRSGEREEEFEPADEQPTPDSFVEHADDEERPRSKVVIEDTHMEIEPPVAIAEPESDPKLVADLERCRERKEKKVAALWSSYRLILMVLFGAGLFLVLGLAIHGLRMTHKVAGPLFKVGLYLDKLRKGTYDQVWNLRKGDQLMEFYEHFRAAHRELAHMQADDIAALEKFLDTVRAAEAAQASDELKAAIAELDELLVAKRDGLTIPGDKRD